MTVSHGVRRKILFLAPLLAFPQMASAADDVTVSADVSANAGYSNNPFSEAGSNTGSGYAQARISPAVKLANETSIFTLLGIFSDKQYFQHYQNVYDLAGQLQYTGTPNERLKTHADLKYDNSIVGQNGYNGSALDSSTTSAPVTSGTDISLFGTRDRRQNAQADGGLDYALSSHDSLTVSGYYLLTRYSQAVVGGNYDGYGFSAGYSRKIAEHAQIGAQTSYAHYSYEGGLGSTDIISPQATFSAKLVSYWTVDGAVGASFISSSFSGKKTTFTANLDVCRATTRTNFCLTGRRAALPTGAGEIQNELLVGANYSYKVTEKSTITANANYTQNSQIQTPTLGPNKYVRGALGYDRRISKRMHITIDGRYANIFGTNEHRVADFGGQLGIIAKLGRSE
jgi:hypothetical protein